MKWPAVNSQPQLLQIALDPGDVVYTPDWVARDMVDFFKPSGKILEPCAGDGVFLKYLPPDAEWCEIEKGRDFFSWRERVDWIVGNPPWKQFKFWLLHSFELTDNLVYLLPSEKYTNSFARIQMIYSFGGIPSIRHYGAGHKLGFPCGFPISAIHFQRGYTGGMFTSFYELDERTTL